MFSYKVFSEFLKSWTDHDFLLCKSIFSFTTLLSVLQRQRSTKWKCRQDSTFLTLFSCEHPVAPGEILVQQKKKWSRKDVQILCYSVPCHLSVCHWACHFLSHTDYLTPSALWCKPLLAHTSAITLAATKSSAHTSEQVKSKQYRDEHLPLLIWVAITVKLIHVIS